MTRTVSVSDAIDLLKSALTPAAAQRLELRSALGAVIAEDVIAPQDVPSRHIALEAGFAIEAALTVGASAFTPLALSAAPVAVGVGDPMPEATDAILGAHALDLGGPIAAALDTAIPWANVRRVGEDARSGAVLLSSGRVLRAHHIAALAALGIKTVAVRRATVAIDDAQLREGWFGRMLAAHGASIAEKHAAHADLVLTTASPRSIATFSTVALRPGLGEVAVGLPDGRATVRLPSRVDGRFAAFLAIVRPLLDHLQQRTERRASKARPLAAKLAVPAGFSNLVLVTEDKDAWRVVAAGDTTYSAWLEAEAWALAAPSSEGMPPGAMLAAESLGDFA